MKAVAFLVSLLAVTDSGSALTAGLTVDGFGPELTPVSATPNVGTCTTAATRISCSFGGLPPDSPGVVTTCVFQVASAGGVTIDADPTFPIGAFAGHKVGTLALTLNPAAADLSVTVPAATLKPKAGGSVTTAATVRNLGPSPAHAPQLAFTLPSGIKLVSATVSSGTCSVATRTCAFADLAGQATAVVRLTLRDTSTTAKHVTVFASAPGEFDPATADNHGSLAVAPPPKPKH